jgi:hypothetical protein
MPPIEGCRSIMECGTCCLMGGSGGDTSRGYVRKQVIARSKMEDIHVVVASSGQDLEQDTEDVVFAGCYEYETLLTLVEMVFSLCM